MRTAGSTKTQLRQCGVTLLELMVVLVIAAVLASIAIPSYSSYVDRANIDIAKADIQDISLAIERFYVRRSGFPESLEDIGMHTREDPWGNTYRYLNIQGTTEKERKKGFTGKGKDKENMRRDRNLKPINSDYDLYSVGKDGVSKPQLNAKPSRDDIVRAADGKFVGVAEDY
ncbi:MAG: prepilin-type N-terminal cleavage/methylation domain-containing protein [Xanthomonadales bacterium]|nr:prepilin-type N-terminal cleavage/methylation domain-containing protein [Xanthomonadales bacterium]